MNAAQDVLAIILMRPLPFAALVLAAFTIMSPVATRAILRDPRGVQAVARGVIARTAALTAFYLALIAATGGLKGWTVWEIVPGMMDFKAHALILVGGMWWYTGLAIWNARTQERRATRPEDA